MTSATACVMSIPSATSLLWAVIDEAALRRQVGGREVGAAQLAHLAKAASSSHIRIQVVPFGAGAHPGMTGSCIIMDFADPFDAPLVYVDTMAGDLFLESDEDVERFTASFERIADVALNPTQSRKFIQDLARAG